MNKKVILGSLLTLFITGSGIAQDKIYVSDGDVIEAEILKVGEKAIVYKPWSDKNGRKVNLDKKKIDKIVYQDGTEDVFAEAATPLPIGIHSPEGEGGASRHSHNNHILAAAPIQFTDNGVGFAFSYEQTLDKDGIVSFIVPVVATFNPDYSDQNSNMDPMYYVMPGVKIYPTGSRGKVRYAVGASVVVGAGEKRGYNLYSYTSSYMNYQTTDRFLVGLMVTNSVNFRPTKHIYMGLDLGIGVTYINKWGGRSQGMSGVASGGFKIGYAF